MGFIDWMKNKLQERRERYAARVVKWDRMDRIMDMQQFAGRHPIDTLNEIAAFDHDYGGAAVPWKLHGRNGKPILTADQVERGIPYMQEEPPERWVKALEKLREEQGEQSRER